MTPTAALAAFTLAAAFLTITPGLDTALVLRTAVAESRRSALAAALGICAGCLAWAGLVALGVGALLAASELAYTVLRILGAAYLAWLGVGLLLRRRPLALDVAVPSSAPSRQRHGSPVRWFVKGLLNNLLNPKIGIFYVSFLPQFVADGVAAAPFMVLLGAIHAGLGVLWFAVLIAATRAVGSALARPGVVRWLDRLTGVAFVGFGARLAFADER